MKRSDEARVVDTALDALDRVVDSLDLSTDQELDAARLKALDAGQGRPSRSWIWALAPALALVLAIVLVTNVGNGSDHANIGETLVADAELYEDLEFYQWLSEELE